MGFMQYFPIKMGKRPEESGGTLSGKTALPSAL
jgi:hypothetical protein